MYFWKSWHDTRIALLAWTLIAVVVIGSISFGMLVRKAPPNSNGVPRLALVRVTEPAQQASLWRFLATIGSPMAFLATFAALSLGSMGLGSEDGAGTLEFLLTRPRRRRYFVWTSWLVPLLEVAVLIEVATATAMSLGFYCTHNIASWRVLGVLPVVLPSAAIILGVTYLATVIGRSGRTGIAITLGIVLVYGVLVEIILGKFQIRLPWWWFDNLPDLFARNDHGFPIVSTAGWMAFSLLFPFAAQKIMEKREI